MSFLVSKLGLAVALGLSVSACGGDDDSVQVPGTGGSSGSGAAAGTGGTGTGGTGTGGTGGTSNGGDSGASEGGAPSGAAGDDGAGGGETIEIAGTWTDSSFGFTETDVIDDHAWSSDVGDGPTVVSITEFSNSERYAIRKAPKDAAYSPNTYDRVLWTKPEGGSFYYCTVIYGCETAAQTEKGDGDASSTTCKLSEVDDSDPANGGCGTFAWSKLSAQ
jgi:hypothetical protein